MNFHGIYFIDSNFFLIKEIGALQWKQNNKIEGAYKNKLFYKMLVQKSIYNLVKE